MLLHERPLHLSRFVGDEDHDQVLKTNQPTRVLDHINVFRAPGLVRTRRVEAGFEPHGLDEIEGRPIGACHREDRAPIALELVDSGSLDRAPRLARLRRERNRRAFGGAAARPHFIARLERPAEGVLARWSFRRSQASRGASFRWANEANAAPERNG
jgi:hypothetical protein